MIWRVVSEDSFCKRLEAGLTFDFEQFVTCVCASVPDFLFKSQECSKICSLRAFLPSDLGLFAIKLCSSDVDEKWKEGIAGDPGQHVINIRRTFMILFCFFPVTSSEGWLEDSSQTEPLSLHNVPNFYINYSSLSLFFTYSQFAHHMDESASRAMTLLVIRSSRLEPNQLLISLQAVQIVSRTLKNGPNRQNR